MPVRRLLGVVLGPVERFEPVPVDDHSNDRIIRNLAAVRAIGGIPDYEGIHFATWVITQAN